MAALNAKTVNAKSVETVKLNCIQKVSSANNKRLWQLNKAYREAEHDLQLMESFSTVLRENSKRHHSQKPECAYQMLETFFPQAKKLELFARAERDGWDQWGNEL